MANPGSRQRRVVITGMGLISPLGNSKHALWESLLAGRSGVAPFQVFPAGSLPIGSGAEARDFRGEIDDFGPLEKARKRAIQKCVKLMCREIAMGVAASQLALVDAGLVPPDAASPDKNSRDTYDPERTGVLFGSDHIMTAPEEFTLGVTKCMQEGEFQFGMWADQGIKSVNPLWLLKYLPNMPASHVAIYNDLRGPNNSLTLREASPNLAVAEAYCTIVRGNADRMLAGATGSRIHPLRTVHVILQEELARNGRPPHELSRPFDLHRTGMVVGEGAGVIMLEELKAAESRGATIYGEVVGHGSSTVMDRSGAARIDTALENVIRRALASGEMSNAEVGHIHAHGASTRQGDIDEARAIQKVFAGRSVPLPVVAAKSYFGNLGAGSGMIEMIASVLALHHQRLFRTLNYETPDPACPISVAAAEGAPGDSFLNLNVTPQGQASAVAIRRMR